MLTLKEPFDFLWDKGNQDKNWDKHTVSNSESEEIFFDDKKKIFFDKIHSEKEERWIIVGNSKSNRRLFIVFTLRNSRIRIISARDLSQKEKYLYEKAN